MKRITLVSLFFFSFFLFNCSRNNFDTNFVGVFIEKHFDEKTLPPRIIISKLGDGYLVIYKKNAYGDDEGSFKEVGKVEDKSIIINPLLKLSVINDSTILMKNQEFVKSEKSFAVEFILAKNKRTMLEGNIESKKSNVDAAQSRIEDSKNVNESPEKQEFLKGAYKRLKVEQEKLDESEKELKEHEGYISLLESIYGSKFDIEKYIEENTKKK